MQNINQPHIRWRHRHNTCLDEAVSLTSVVLVSDIGFWIIGTVKKDVSTLGVLNRLRWALIRNFEGRNFERRLRHVCASTRALETHVLFERQACLFFDFHGRLHIIYWSVRSAGRVLEKLIALSMYVMIASHRRAVQKAECDLTRKNTCHIPPVRA